MGSAGTVSHIPIQRRRRFTQPHCAINYRTSLSPAANSSKRRPERLSYRQTTSRCSHSSAAAAGRAGARKNWAAHSTTRARVSHRSLISDRSEPPAPARTVARGGLAGPRSTSAAHACSHDARRRSAEAGDGDRSARPVISSAASPPAGRRIAPPVKRSERGFFPLAAVPAAGGG